MLCVAARALAAAPPRRLCEGRRRVARAKDSRFDPDQIPSPRQDAPLRLKKRSKGETAPTAAARPAPALFGGVLSSETAGHYAIAGMLGVWAVTLLAAPHPIVSPVFSSLGGGEALCLALRTSGVGAACGAVIALMLAQMPGTYRAARIGAAGLALCAMAALGAAFAPGAAAVGLAATATQTATSTALCAAGTLTALLTAAFESAVVMKQIGKARAKANY